MHKCRHRIRVRNVRSTTYGRHCDAEPGAPDLTRKLTARGARDAKRMAVWLEARLPADCRILASPARRTQETAAALGRTFETSDAIAPGASAE